MTKSGCPDGDFWHEGTRFHDTQDGDPNNYWSNPYDLAGRVAKKDMEQKFCMKTKRKTSKKGDCPEGQHIALPDVPYFNDESFLIDHFNSTA